MTKLVIVEGFDPTSVATPSNSQLLQMVHEAQPASDVGFVIFADDPPDIVQYPVLERFLWLKTASGVPNGEVYYNDGASWTLITALTLSGGDLADGSVTLSKLSPDGNAYQIIRINAGQTAFEFIDLLDAIAAGTLPLTKLATATGANYFLRSNGSNVWAEVTAAVAYLTLQSSGSTLTALTSKEDFVTILKSDGSTSWKMTVESFLSDSINQLDAITTTVDADTVAVRQASGGLAKEVTLANLLPDKGTAGTVTNPTSITTDAKGRVTAVSSSATAKGTRWTSAETALPTVAGAAGLVTIAHGYSGNTPGIVQVWLKCTDAGGNANYAQNDEIDARSVYFDLGAGDNTSNGYVIRRDTTNIYIMQPAIAGGGPFVPDKTNGAELVAFTPTKWKAIVECTL